MQNASLFWFGGSPQVNYDPDAQAYFDQVVLNALAAGWTLQEATLSTSWKKKLNAWFLSAKQSGNFYKYIRLHFLNNEHTIAARTSVVNPAQPMCEFKSDSSTEVVFMVWNGVQTSSIFYSYIDTKFNPSLNGGVLFTLNDAWEGYGVNKNVDGLYVDMGGSDGVNSDYSFSAFGGNSYSKLNSVYSGNGLTLANASNLDAHYSITRQSPTTITWWKNNTGTPGADSSTGLMNKTHYLGAFHNAAGSAQYHKSANYTWFGYGAGSIDIAAHNNSIDSLFSRKSCVLYGNSITFGSDGTTFHVNDFNWASMVCRAKGWKEDNRAVNSTTLLNANPIDVVAAPNLWEIQNTIPQYDADLYAHLSINHAVNDCGLNYPAYTSTLFKSQYLDILNTAATTKNWNPQIVGIDTGTYVDSGSWANYIPVLGGNPPADNARYLDIRTKASEACAQYGCILIEPYSYLQNANNQQSIFQLGVHLNRWGNDNMKNYYLSQIPTL